MNAQELVMNLSNLLEPKLEEQDLFLVDVLVKHGNDIQVFADGDQNISLDQCAEINHFLLNELNASGWAGSDFSIEVSSPGMDAAFKLLRQYKKRIGRIVEVLMKNGVKKFGKLSEADENKIRIIPFDPNKIIKGKPITWNENETIEIEFEQIKNVKLSLDF